MKHFIIIGEPAYKPRMTKRDVWAKRPCVEKYRAWADVARLAVTGDHAVRVPDAGIIGFYAIFNMPVNDSWPETRKSLARGRYHTGRPDTDNLMKAVADALFVQDWNLSIMTGVKRYVSSGMKPSVHLYLIEENDIDNFGVPGMISIPPSPPVNGMPAS